MGSVLQKKNKIDWWTPGSSQDASLSSAQDLQMQGPFLWLQADGETCWSSGAKKRDGGRGGAIHNKQERW